MSSLKYYNNLVDLNSLFYNSHLELIKNICQYLKKESEIGNIKELYLDKIKLKQKRDPLKPKRPKNSYTFFCLEYRKELKMDNPLLKFIEINKKLGKRWRSISKEKKEKYIKLAEVEKKKYIDSMTKYSK